MNRITTKLAVCATVGLGLLGNVHAQQPSALKRLPPVATGQSAKSPVSIASWETAADSAEPAVIHASYQVGQNGAGSSPRLQQFENERELSTQRLANNFTKDPDFGSGIVVTGEDIALKIGGYVKADLIHDFNAINSPDSFITTDIPTSGPQWQNARFHAKQSRLSFDTRWKTEGDTVRAFFEGDFFGGEQGTNGMFRLRHAYGTVRHFTAGQTWTTFTDPSAVPQTLDMEGAVSNVNRRQGLVRWQQPIWGDDVLWAIALEDPEIVIEAPSMVTGEGRTESPDFITRLRWQPSWGEFQGALVIRELGFQPNNEPVIKQTAWGFNFTGSFFVVEGTKAYYHITFGDGIGSYRGSPDVVATGPETAAVVSMFGWMVGVHHEWTERLTSNFTFSKLSMEDVQGQDPDNLRGTTYMAINLIANPYERVFVGVEYLYGVRDDVSRARGSAHRVQMSFGFYLP